MKPWREIAIPHEDVLEGTFQQSEFAADITAVHSGKSSKEYQDPAAFFERTFITEGMRHLLTSVVRRLNKKGGDPVIQLQTAFGGGKTHTMLAVYHLATRVCPLKDLRGVSPLLKEADSMDVPKARVAVIDGNAHGPGQPWMRGSQEIKTLWGELGWQLGGEDGYKIVEKADATGTSPGKTHLKELLERFAPCVVLIDELVAYIRQFPDGSPLSGGSYDSNLSFIQALTEAAKLAPNAIVLASLPESEIEAGSERGATALKALEKTFGRVQRLWKPVDSEEAFEIVRRRLFEPIEDTKSRDEVCHAFAKTYVEEGTKLPSETQEGSYRDRLTKAYPIHPEIFDRLYQDWSTLEGFQRTRGVLKLMAKVIYRLWKDENKDYLILPGSLPLYDGETRNELTYYLQAGWDAVLEKDIDGERAETSALENKETRFGKINAARRVARTLFLGSAPSNGVGKQGARGMDLPRVLLGCLQPGQGSATFADALNRLSDRLHYLNSSADRRSDSTHYWFDTRANLRREMEDRKGRFSEQNEVRATIAEVLRKLTAGLNTFDGAHPFTPHADVPDDGALRLVLLPPDKFYSKQEKRLAEEEVLTYLRNNGTRPRHYANRLLFIAPDHASLGRLKEAALTVLAWNSIIEDVKDGRLNIDRLTEKQAQKHVQTAEEVLPRAARECYKWLLCPSLPNPTDKDPLIEAFPLNTGGASFSAAIERVCKDNELVIAPWSPIHLRAELQKLYWKDDRADVRARDFWEDSMKYLYLPRLSSEGVLEQAIETGAGSEDFFGTAYGKSGGKYEGFKLGDGNVQLDSTLLLIEPGAARRYAAASAPAVSAGGGTSTLAGSGEEVPREEQEESETAPASSGVAADKAHSFFGSIEVDPTTAKAKFVELADEIVNVLASDPNASMKVTVEIKADFPKGASDQIKRAVSENATHLGFKSKDWE